MNHEIGSLDPARVGGLLRLYSMVYCPFAERPLLILKAKKLPFEIVNINLVRKPEWYFKYHPEGKFKQFNLVNMEFIFA